MNDIDEAGLNRLEAICAGAGLAEDCDAADTARRYVPRLIASLRSLRSPHRELEQTALTAGLKYCELLWQLEIALDSHDPVAINALDEECEPARESFHAAFHALSAARAKVGT